MLIVHSEIQDAYNAKYTLTIGSTSYCKRLGSQNALQTLLTLDLYFRGPENYWHIVFYKELPLLAA